MLQIFKNNGIMEVKTIQKNTVCLKSQINKGTVIQKMKLVLLAMFLILSVNNYAQVTNNSLSGLQWQIDNTLTVYSNSIQQLRVENKNGFPTDFNNNINFSSVFLPIGWKGDGAFVISFNLVSTNDASYTYQAYEIKNGKRTRKKQTYTSGAYWGLFIELYGVDGSTVSNTVWYSAKGGGEYSYNSNNEGWKKSYTDLSRDKITISKLSGGSIYIRGYASTQWSNISGIKSITIMVGAKAQLQVTDFSFSREETRVTASSNNSQQSSSNQQRQQFSGEYNKILAKGDEYLQKEMYADAVREYTNAINQGYQNAEIFAIRAFANAKRNYYQDAINDCNRALQYNSNYEYAYYLRGLCKLKNNDDSGVADLRKGGEAGIAALKDLEYYQNQNNSNTRRQQQTVPQNTLKKDPNFKIE